MVSKEIETAFPNLTKNGFTITSPATEDYNCLAWAADESERWWWPDPFYVNYWPEDALRDETLEAFAQAYQTLGYEPCAEEQLETGFEKVAVYADSEGTPTHAARQLPSGQWSSKLGSLEDITHSSLDALAGELYGAAVLLLKRPVKETRGG